MSDLEKLLDVLDELGIEYRTKRLRSSREAVMLEESDGGKALSFVFTSDGSFLEKSYLV